MSFNFMESYKLSADWLEWVADVACDMYAF